MIWVQRNPKQWSFTCNLIIPGCSDSETNGLGKEPSFCGEVEPPCGICFVTCDKDSILQRPDLRIAMHTGTKDDNID